MSLLAKVRPLLCCSYCCDYDVTPRRRPSAFFLAGIVKNELRYHCYPGQPLKYFMSFVAVTYDYGIIRHLVYEDAVFYIFGITYYGIQDVFSMQGCIVIKQ